MSYIAGDHNVISDITGFKKKRSECRFDWRGFLMENEQFSVKQPQLNIRPQGEKIAVADPRPRQPTQWAEGQGPDDPKISF